MTTTAHAIRTAPSDCTVADPGFEIGWDYARHRLVPPPEQMLPGNPVRQGWEASQAVFGQRTLPATRHVRTWLQLRLHAWLRGHAFEGFQVTPQLLKLIDVPTCPITGEELTHGTGLPTDAVVDRVNIDAGYAAGNLAVMSQRASAARSHHGWRGCAELARQIEAGQFEQIAGLTARHWSRLATLASLCTPLAHAEAICLPLRVLPPKRLRVINPVQALQVMLTLRFTRPGQMPQVDQLARIFPDVVRPALHAFLTTLLARRLEAGPGASAEAMRSTMEAAWASPLVLKRWQGLALRLSAAQCELIVALAVTHGLAGRELRCLSPELATEGWALASHGRAQDAWSSGHDDAAARLTGPACQSWPRPSPTAAGANPVQTSLVWS